MGENLRNLVGRALTEFAGLVHVQSFFLCKEENQFLTFFLTTNSHIFRGNFLKLCGISW